MATAAKPLKSQNVRWIWAVIALDMLALAAFTYPGVLDQDVLSARSALKLVGAGAAPVVVLLLTSLLPSDGKAVLVFWRFRNVLPGHRAFSKHASADPRVNMESLRKNVGAFPEDPKEQNGAWYRLFKKVEADPSVAQAHKHYLLFRDLAALSIVLGVIAPGVLLALGGAPEVVLAAAGLFMAQYAASAIAARNGDVP